MLPRQDHSSPGVPLRVKLESKRNDGRVLSPGFGINSLWPEYRSQQYTSTQPVFEDDSDDLEFMDADKIILTDTDVNVDSARFTPKKVQSSGQMASIHTDPH